MVRTRKIYTGGDDDGGKPCWVFTVNGKGDWGDERPWDAEDWDVALGLAKSVSAQLAQWGYCRENCDYIFEGDAIWFVFSEPADAAVGEWKEDVSEAYGNWKRACE